MPDQAEKPVTFEMPSAPSYLKPSGAMAAKDFGDTSRQLPAVPEADEVIGAYDMPAGNFHDLRLLSLTSYAGPEADIVSSKRTIEQILGQREDPHISKERKVFRQQGFLRRGRLNPFGRLRYWWARHFMRVPLESFQETIQEKLSNEELWKLDPIKRMRLLFVVPPPIKIYDATLPVTNLFHLQGTAVKAVIKRFDTWMLMCIHLAFVIVYYKAEGAWTARIGADGTPTLKWWPQMSTTLVAIPGSLLSFLLVFYTSQAYNRFFHLYSTCQGIYGNCAEMTMLLRVHFADHLFAHAKEMRQELWNQVNAVHLLGYAGLPQQRARYLDEWAWQYAFQRGLLTFDQIQYLHTLAARTRRGNMAWREIITWLQAGFMSQVHANKLHPIVANGFMTKLLEMRQRIDTLYEYSFGPIPYPYYHIMNVMIYAYLLVLSYALTFVSPWCSIFGYLLILLAMLGLRELSNALADPFGSDDTDLPVFDWVELSYRQNRYVLDRGSWHTKALPRHMLPV